jgi:galactokinase
VPEYKSETKVETHGRVNLIGEHTDYNGGFVLPTLIPQKTSIRLRPRADQKVVAVSTHKAFGTKANRAEYELGTEKKAEAWIDYIAGATKLLKAGGHKFSGFDLEIDSNVPLGSGLSSSAALEVGVTKAIRDAFGLKISDVEVAQLGQRIENEFVGAHVGIMDQMVCSLGKEGHALYLDTLKMTYEMVPLPKESADLVVINSGIAHRLSDGGGYNRRRAECEESCRILGVKLLRELTTDDLPKVEKLPEPLKRRARHVITENSRVLSAVSALKARRLNELGELFYKSHESMRDDYEVSIPEIDLLVELCRKESGTIGARLTGGGFGGSIVALTQLGRGESVAKAVVEAYAKQTQEHGTILVP